jgi:sec-independent protein translocase protein TatC
MPALRPIAHEDRLSLVEHLDELRTRLIYCLIAFAVSFGFCYWQNDNILDIVNKPVKDAQSLDSGDKKRSQDPLEQSALFSKRVGEMSIALGPVLRIVQRDARTDADKRAIAEAIRRTKIAADATPTATGRRPITLGITEPFLTTFKVASYSAILLVLPFLLFQAYAFILPAFTPKERRAVLPLLAMVPVLFIAGVLFGYFVAMPRAADFLLNFNDDNFDILLRAQDYYSFAVTFLGAIGLMFQVPVGVLILSRLEIVSVRQLRKNRGYVILALAVVAAVATPTPDPVTMLVSMLPLLVLFELSILLAAALERRRAREPDPFDTDLTLLD